MNKSWLKQSPLPFSIITKPTPKNVTEWFDTEEQGVNDKELIIILAAKGISVGALFFCFVGIVGIVAMSIGAIIYGFKKVSISDFFLIISIPFIIAFLFWLYSFVKPIKKLTLRRFTGIMTYPSYGFYPHFTITFTRAKVYRSINSGPDATISGASLAARNPYNTGVGKGNYDLASADPEEWWSFFVWYMDKNRPLPPGKAFDMYREKDFERRKAEGFPKPLYPSNIPTPEFTNEQQKERKLIGGW